MASEKMTAEDFRKVLEATHPHLLLMQQYINEHPNSRVTFDCRMFNGKVQDVVVTRAERHKM